MEVKIILISILILDMDFSISNLSLQFINSNSLRKCKTIIFYDVEEIHETNIVGVFQNGSSALLFKISKIKNAHAGPNSGFGVPTQL